MNEAIAIKKNLDFIKTLLKNFKELQKIEKYKNLGQFKNSEDLANGLGIKYSTFRAMRNHSHRITLAAVLKLADYLEMDWLDLLTDNPNPRKKEVPYMIDPNNRMSEDYSNETFQKIHNYFLEVKTNYFFGMSRSENTSNPFIFDENCRNSTTLYRYKKKPLAYLQKNLRLDVFLDLCNYLCESGKYNLEDLL